MSLCLQIKSCEPYSTGRPGLVIRRSIDIYRLFSDWSVHWYLSSIQWLVGPLIFAVYSVIGLSIVICHLFSDWSVYWYLPSIHLQKCVGETWTWSVRCELLLNNREHLHMDAAYSITHSMASKDVDGSLVQVSGLINASFDSTEAELNFILWRFLEPRWCYQKKRTLYFVDLGIAFDLQSGKSCKLSLYKQCSTTWGRLDPLLWGHGRKRGHGLSPGRQAFESQLTRVRVLLGSVSGSVVEFSTHAGRSG